MFYQEIEIKQKEYSIHKTKEHIILVFKINFQLVNMLFIIRYFTTLMGVVSGGLLKIMK